MTSISFNTAEQIIPNFENCPKLVNLGLIVFKGEPSELIYTRNGETQKSLEVVSLTSGQRYQLQSYICPDDGVPFTRDQLEAIQKNLASGRLDYQSPLKGGGNKHPTLRSQDHVKEPTDCKQAVCVHQSVFRHETKTHERRPSLSKTDVDEVHGEPKSVRILAEKIKKKVEAEQECRSLIAKARYVIEAYKSAAKTFDLMLEYTHLAKCGHKEICKLMLEGLIEDLKKGGLDPYLLITIRETMRHMDFSFVDHNLINKLLVNLEDVCIEDKNGKFIEDSRDSAVLSTIISTLVATLQVIVKNDVQNVSYEATQKRLYNFFKRIAENKKNLWSKRMQEKAVAGMQVAVRVHHDSSKRKENLKALVKILRGLQHVGNVITKQNVMDLERAYKDFEAASYSQKEKEEWFDSLTALEEIVKVGGKEMRDFFGLKFLELATKINKDEAGNLLPVTKVHKEQAGHLLAGVIDILSHITSYGENYIEQQEALKMLLGVFFTNDPTSTTKAFNALLKYLDDDEITLIRAELERQIVEWSGDGRSLEELARTNLINIRGFSPKYLTEEETLLNRASIISLASREAPKMERSTTLMGLALKREELVDAAIKKIKDDELDPEVNNELVRHRARFVLPDVTDEKGVTQDGLQAYLTAVKDYKMIVFKGPAGAGKTTLLNEIRYMTQEQGKEDPNHFSVTVHLGKVNKNSKDYLFDGCLKMGLTHRQAEMASADKDMVFNICMDAKDEMEGDPKNEHSALPMSKISPKSKICLTHRDQALPVNDETMLYFAPIVGGEIQSSQLKVFTISPVDRKKAKTFFEKAVANKKASEAEARKKDPVENKKAPVAEASKKDPVAEASKKDPVWEAEDYMTSMEELGLFNEDITYLTLDIAFNALPKVAKDLKGKHLVEIKLALYKEYVQLRYTREGIKMVENGQALPQGYANDCEGFDQSAARLMDLENWTSLTPPNTGKFKKKKVNKELEELFKKENAIYFRGSFLQRIGGSLEFESHNIFSYILLSSHVDSLEEYVKSGKDMPSDEHFNLKEITNKTLLEFFHWKAKSNPKFKAFLEKVEKSESCKIAAKNAQNILNFKQEESKKSESKKSE